MYSTETLSHYLYLRQYCATTSHDAVVDTAQFFGIQFADFARFLRAVGVPVTDLL